MHRGPKISGGDPSNISTQLLPWHCKSATSLQKAGVCLLGIHAQPSYWLDLGAWSCGTLTSIRLLDLVPLLTKETYKNY